MLRKVFNVLTTILLVLLIITVVFLFITRASGKSPSVLGFHFFRVTTGSMEPVLKVGDIITCKEVSVDQIHKGDIITYKGLEGDYDGKVITHEVVEEPYEDNGHYFIQTQGHVAGAPLDPLIRYEQVEGKYLFSLGVLTFIYNLFLSKYGLFVFIGIIVLLFGYEVVSLVMSHKSADELVYDEEKGEIVVKKKSKKKNK